ncbi:hypothetical protein [Laspinema olomoucense]|uniref:hypothetical protein n=1 Tax=Laspinema olomoucense TaxID=3231600 RepID=UPI0021BBA757|nr:hypothetical protein [Laspinema sp. D3a]MCT7988511.1 hypothetical protein [Laspinema sp. D3a]
MMTSKNSCWSFFLARHKPGFFSPTQSQEPGFLTKFLPLSQNIGRNPVSSPNTFADLIATASRGMLLNTTPTG